MALFGDPFIISKTERDKEVDKIHNFLKSLPAFLATGLVKKYGTPETFISFYHFTLATKISLIEDEQGLHFLPLGYMSGTTAFIYIPSFDDSSNPQESVYTMITRANNIILELNDMNPTDWIIDVRGNGGGLLHNFVSYISPFLPDLTLNLASKDGEITIEINKGSMVWNNPGFEVTKSYIPTHNTIKSRFRILINDKSYSGAEFLSYLMKKFCNAEILGFTSGGALTTMNNIQWEDNVTYVPYGEIVDPILKGNRYLIPDSPGYPVL